MKKKQFRIKRLDKRVIELGSSGLEGVSANQKTTANFSSVSVLVFVYCRSLISQKILGFESHFRHLVPFPRIFFKPRL